MAIAFRVMDFAGNRLSADHARLAVVGASIGVFQLCGVRDESLLGHHLAGLGDDVAW